MLFRVLSEIIVCVAASFERRQQWLRRGDRSREERQKTLEELREREKEKETPRETSSQRDGTITSYFSQRSDKTPVILRVYGIDEQSAISGIDKRESNGIDKQESNGIDKHESNGIDKHESLTTPCFEEDAKLVENMDPSGSLSGTTDFFAAMLRRVAAKDPESLRSLLASRPYLFHLRFGEQSLADMLQTPPPFSLTQYSKSSDELANFMQTLTSTPELSLEVIPAVGYLALLLRTSQRVYQRWIAEQSLLPEAVQQCFLYCVRLASFFVASGNEYAQVLLGEVLGLLSAVAPDRFAAMSREDGVQTQLSEFDLARVMIKRFFVKDLMGLPRSEIQNRIAFTVQSLLRFLQEKMDGEAIEKLTSDRVLLLRVAKEVREVERGEE